MSTCRKFVISSKIVSTIVHLQRGDICMAENKVWLLFGGLNFGISRSKSVTGDILQMFCLCLYLQKPIPGLPNKGFYLSQQTFPLVFQTRATGTASARMGTLLVPAEPIADQCLQIPFCRAAPSFLLMSQYTWKINVLNISVSNRKKTNV